MTDAPATAKTKTPAPTPVAEQLIKALKRATNDPPLRRWLGRLESAGRTKRDSHR
jgi:hypothetical protein